tara:strand:+ start:203 stop:625 length:423 start_codon:yes stop_codon:yes gene_type:complete
MIDSLGAAAPAAETQPKSLSSAAGLGRDELGRDAFLNLLVTQLQNQSPLQPQDNSEFIAQLAQFSQLENAEQSNDRLGSLLEASQLSQGAGLVGKTVSFLGADGSEASGVVDRAHLVSGKVELEVEGQRLPLGNVRSVAV